MIKGMAPTGRSAWALLSAGIFVVFAWWVTEHLPLGDAAAKRSLPSPLVQSPAS